MCENGLGTDESTLPSSPFLKTPGDSFFPVAGWRPRSPVSGPFSPCGTVGAMLRASKLSRGLWKRVSPRKIYWL